MRIARRLYLTGLLLIGLSIVTRVAQIVAGAPSGEQVIGWVWAGTGWSALLVGHIVEAIERKDAP